MKKYRIVLDVEYVQESPEDSFSSPQQVAKLIIDDFYFHELELGFTASIVSAEEVPS